ncbi:hypothetical protein [Bacillus safensis]|uniref:hypothetical protein n=1 Tax=Bacillus safensis TaxID=561879 RepID=UPI0021CA0F48|nr:hypothetical protein [Bacillus safensis]MCU0155719.1 hypothetical protein [Bacillus safensis]
MNTVPAIVFKNKHTERYLSYGPDFMDLTDPNGDVKEITDALCLIRKDREKPSDQDLTDFYNMVSQHNAPLDINDLKNCYYPAHVDYTIEEFERIKARHEEEY